MTFIKKLITLLLILTCTSCSLVKNDQAFLHHVSQGLEKKITFGGMENPKNMSENEYNKHFVKACEKEIETIGNIQDYTFQDEELRKIAQDYMDMLELQLSGKKDEILIGWSHQIVLAQELNEDYDIECDQQILEAANQVRPISDTYEIERYIKETMKIKYDEKNSTQDLQTYQASFKNFTNTPFDTIKIDVEFYDADNNIIIAQSDQTTRIEPGTKGKFQFFFSLPEQSQKVKRIEVKSVHALTNLK